MLEIKALTLGEVATIEKLSEQPITAIGDDNRPKGLQMAAMAMVVKRRQLMHTGLPPKFSWNEALALTTDEANDILGITDDESAEDDPAPDGDATDIPGLPDEPPAEPVDPTPAPRKRAKS